MGNMDPLQSHPTPPSIAIPPAVQLLPARKKLPYTVLIVALLVVGVGVFSYGFLPNLPITGDSKQGKFTEPTPKDTFFFMVGKDFGQPSICAKISPQATVDSSPSFGEVHKDYVQS